jgi:hypothetical protein
MIDYFFVLFMGYGVKMLVSTYSITRRTAKDYGRK